MSLKFRLAFLYSMSVFIILLLSAVSIFIFNENFRREEFNKRLIAEGAESAKLISTVSTAPKGIVETLNKIAAASSHQLKVYFFDFGHHLLLSTKNSPALPLPYNAFDMALDQKNYVFSVRHQECVLSFFQQPNQFFFVLATGYDTYGHRKSENLKLLLATSILGGLLLSGFLAFFYVRHAMSPLEDLKGQIEKIDEKNLKERIRVGNKNNEVWQIAKKFNAMLHRLEQAFEQRKNFVQHASHELRTPLANMLSQTEAALNKDMSAPELRHVLISLKEDQQDLIALTNSLLTLSRYENITSNADWTTVRIDEVIYDVIDFANEVWPAAVVTVDFERVPENENELEFKGNESLIKSAVQNLIKNAINYSKDSRAKVSILAEKKGITLHFDNLGKLLTNKEQGKLFMPFFRGENSVNKKGYGLGLSIVQRIINVHNGTINYEAMVNSINRFTIFLPAI